MFCDVSGKSAGKCQQDSRWEENIKRGGRGGLGCQGVQLGCRGVQLRVAAGRAQGGEEGGGDKSGGREGLVQKP